MASIAKQVDVVVIDDDDDDIDPLLASPPDTQVLVFALLIPFASVSYSKNCVHGTFYTTVSP